MRSRVADWRWECVTDDLRTTQRGPLMLVYLTGVRGQRVVLIQVNWIR